MVPPPHTLAIQMLKAIEATSLLLRHVAGAPAPFESAALPKRAGNAT